MPVNGNDGPTFVTAMFPLSFNNSGIGFDQINRSDLVSIVQQHLKFILFTRPGEIISDIKFGVGLENYIFLNQNEPKLKALKNKIKEQIRKYLGYLTSFDVLVDFSKVHLNKLGVQIKYAIDNLDVDEVATFIVGPEIMK